MNGILLEAALRDGAAGSYQASYEIGQLLGTVAIIVLIGYFVLKALGIVGKDKKKDDDAGA